MKMRVLESPTLYLPSDILTMENCTGHVQWLTRLCTIWSRLWKWQGLRAGGTGGGSGEGRSRSRRSSSSISSSRYTRAGAATPKRQARRPSSSRHNTTLLTFLRSTRSSVSNISTSWIPISLRHHWMKLEMLSLAWKVPG